jgi:hypothetical protein
MRTALTVQAVPAKWLWFEPFNHTIGYNRPSINDSHVRLNLVKREPDGHILVRPPIL